MLRLTALGGLVAVLASACGNGGDASGVTPELEPYFEALLESNSSGLPISEEEEICFATGTVTSLGLDRLEAIGSPDYWRESDPFVMPPEDAEVVSGVLFECAGESLAEDLGEAIAAGLSWDLSTDGRSCVGGILMSGDTLQGLFVAGLAGDTDAVAETETAFVEVIFGSSDPCILDVHRDSFIAGVSGGINRDLTDAEVECLQGVYTDAAIMEYTQAVSEDGLVDGGTAFVDSTFDAASACVT